MALCPQAPVNFSLHFLTQQQHTKPSHLQQACGSREAQSERLALDVERLGVYRLRSHWQRVQTPYALTPSRNPEQRIRAQGHGGVRRVVQVEDGQSQSGEACHERGLNEKCRLRRLYLRSRSEWTQIDTPGRPLHSSRRQTPTARSAEPVKSARLQ